MGLGEIQIITPESVTGIGSGLRMFEFPALRWRFSTNIWKRSRRMTDENKIYRCRHCHVQVISKTNTRAILGRSHGKHCPRRNK